MDYYLAFSYSPIGPKKFKQLFEHFGDLEKMWGAGHDALRGFGIGEVKYRKFDEFRRSFQYENELAKLEKLSVVFVSQNSNSYPSELLQLENPPIGIYVRGDVGVLSLSPRIGVVGTRKMTAYGERVTEDIVEGLVSRGCVIVSGLALGVDACAHKVCVKGGGCAIAVLGGGVDLPFPRENYGLYQEILKSGGAIISEYPPGTPPMKGSFPARNRIIAALSESLVITEAGEGSGSLITAMHAESLQKKIFSVPGPVGVVGAKGVNLLLRKGALIAECADDVLSQFSIEGGNTKELDMSAFSPVEQQIITCLLHEASDIDALSHSVGMSVNAISPLLSMLEIRGIVVRHGGKFYVTH